MQTVKHGKNISEDLIIIIYRWEFVTEDRDIMFHVFYRDENGKKVDVVPKQKVESNLIMEEGEIICFSPRICKYHFRNRKLLFTFCLSKYPMQMFSGLTIATAIFVLKQFGTGSIWIMTTKLMYSILGRIKKIFPQCNNLFFQ